MRRELAARRDRACQSTQDGVTLHARRSEDPERLAKLLDILRAMVDERRRTGR